MRRTIASAAVIACGIALSPLASGCGVIGDCGWNGEYSDTVGTGSYRAGLATGAGGTGGSYAPPPSNFPHNGHEVSVQVDRENRKVYARWTNDAGEEVVETWRIVE